jgi:hypothetical protein
VTRRYNESVWRRQGGRQQTGRFMVVGNGYGGAIAHLLGELLRSLG